MALTLNRQPSYGASRTGDSSRHHEFSPQNVNKERQTPGSARMRHKSGVLSRSTSTAMVKPPWGLHDIPEESPARLHSTSRGGDESIPAALPRLNSSASSVGGASNRSYGTWLRQHGRGINQSRHTLLSSCSTSSSSPSLRSGGQLVFVNDNERQRTPQRMATPSEKSVAFSHLTSISQKSSASLRLEVEQAVRDEVARAIHPLQERLRSERSKREEVEEQLRKATPSV